jgi:D-alanyl-D-alanine carboxypeptidase (penicillin-binding protein 5/6)
LSNKSIFLTIFVLFIAGFSLAFFYPRRAGQDHVSVTPLPNKMSQAFIMPASEPDYLPLRDFNILDPEIQPKSAVLFDTRSGKFLYEKNIDKKLPIASLTKLMTAVVIVENMNLNSTITVPVEDINVDGYGADLYKDERLRASDLLKIMLIKSSNDAALAFQSEARRQGIDLVQKMVDKADELGMNDTKFTNPAGLDDEAFSTARDLVKLVQYVSKHKLIWEILRTKELDVYSIDGSIVHHLVNTDQLLGELGGIIGGKTGFTDKAMGTMILLVDVNNNFSNLIGVILGSNDRFTDIRRLIEWGKTAYRWH